MSVGQRLREFHGSRKKYLLTLILLIVSVCLLVFSPRTRKDKFDYALALDEVAAVVNGEELTLRELAFYVAYEEAQVHRQALAYNPEKPTEYWNVRIDKMIVRAAARNAAIKMAVHDVLFSQLAEADGVALTEEEERILLDGQENFWQDLVEDGRADGLGVTKEDIFASMRRVALAEEYQAIYEEAHGADAGAYDFDGKAYEEFLDTQDCKLRMDVWKRVDFGNVTLKNMQ